jgi:serine/threonine protein kinase
MTGGLVTLPERKQPSIDQWCVLFSPLLQVARAVAVLHAHNVVHFDIKGDNVLLQHGFDPACGQHSSSSPLASSGSSSRSGSDVVLADFGDALVLEDAHASSQRHRGTELFSSPEMLLLHAGRQHTQHAQHDRRKHRGVHAAHDVWSLGCTLYELLTGTVLFEEEVRHAEGTFLAPMPSTWG